jgi:nucleotide-binding universal stress UspA family protein
MDTIVCGVDPSPGAREALRVAAQLHRSLGFRVVAVHVVDALVRDGPETGTVVRQRREVGNRLLEHLLADGELGSLERRVELGDPVEQLAAVALEEGAELIVIGSQPHGRRWRRTVPSRLAIELAQTTSCPVLVAPPPRANSRKHERRSATLTSA